MIQSKAVVAQDSGERRTERSRPGSYHYSLPVSNSHDLECWNVAGHAVPSLYTAFHAV